MNQVSNRQYLNDRGLLDDSIDPKTQPFSGLIYPKFMSKFLLNQVGRMVTERAKIELIGYQVTS